MSKLDPIETLRVIIDHVRKGQLKHIGFYSNEEIARALEQVIEQASPAPIGYKLVPIKPTPEMTNAALKHAEKWAKFSDDPEQEAKANAWDYLQAYDVMIAAAPNGN